MTNHANPVVVVLSGTKALQPYMDVDVQERRRFIRIELPEISPDSHLDDVKGYVDSYCAQANITNGLQPDDYERLIHAADGQFGWTYARALDGIAEVLASGGTTLTRLALAHAYDRAGHADPALNVFVVDYWRHLLPDAGLREEVPPEKLRRRPRKEQAS